MTVVVPIKITLQLGSYLHGQTPAWVEWPVALILLVALFIWTGSWISYAMGRFYPKIPGSHAEIEAWFRTQVVDPLSNWKITEIESSSFEGGFPASVNISIDDGHESIVVLDCNLRTKRLLGCRAYPSPQP